MTSLPHPGHAGDHALRVALYARVSTDEQAKEGYGLAYQQEQMRAFAEGRSLTIVEAVTEPGVSRTEFARPASIGYASLPRPRGSTPFWRGGGIATSRRSAR